MTWEELYNKHFQDAVRFAKRWTGNTAVLDAEHVAQEAFIKLLRQSGPYSRPMLWQACHSVAVDALRHRFTKLRVDEPLYLSAHMQTGQDVQALADLLPDSGEPVPDVVSEREYVNTINKLIAKLPPQQRLALKESMQNAKLNSCRRSQLCFARKRLRELLQNA